MPQDTPESYHAAVLSALSFFRSVIKCGEPWTPTCEQIYQETKELVEAAGRTR